jgi:5-methylcytosine-specific restriction endonuclease McrA
VNPEQFVKQFAWSMETFRAARETDFRCSYCGHFFFDSVDSWTQFNVDHLRPGAAGDRDERVENKVAACWTCNKLKSNFDPGKERPTATKLELVEIAREHILKARERRTVKVSAMRQAVAALSEPPPKSPAGGA